MHKHETDPVSLVAGLAFVIVAGAYALTQTTSLRLHWVVLVPSLLVLVGVAVIATVARRIGQQSTPAAAAPGAPEPVEPVEPSH